VQYVGVHLDLSIDETAVDHRQTKPNQTKPSLIVTTINKLGD
jgi:hypothetical protein